MNHQTPMGMLADVHQADLREQAHSARLAHEAGHHRSHYGDSGIGAGHRRLVAAVVSLGLALAMSAGVTLAQDAGAPASGGGGCGNTGRIVVC